MAHFERGLQHIAFENQNCFHCLNYRSIQNRIPLLNVKDDKETGFGCALMDMHLFYQDELDEKYLNALISKDFVCSMRLTKYDAKVSLTDYQERLELQNNQLKAGLNQSSLF